jgi:hypothetical protein
VLGCATGASAQLIEGRPFRALFRTVSNPADSRHQVTVLAFLSAGRDEIDLTVADSENLVDPRLRSGTFGSLSLATRYAHQGRRSEFNADGGLVTRYYSRYGLSMMNTFGGVNWSTGVRERGRFTFGQRLAHSPFHTFGQPLSDLDGAEEPFEPPTDQRAFRLETTSYDTQLRFDYQVGRRSHVGLDYGLRYVDVAPRTSLEDARDMIAHRPRIRYRREVGRYASLNLGYGLRRAEYRGSGFDPVTAHDVNFGVGYSRPLSFSRRTRVGFSTGSTVTSQETVNFHVTGSAFLRHAFTRTWNGVLAYHRGMDVREGFSAPFFFFSDSISGTVRGRIAGPVMMQASTFYTHGRFSVDTLENRSDSVSANVALHVPVTTMISASVQGYYADQTFQRRLGLLTGVPLETNTYGVRVGLSLWVPVVR